MSSMTRQYSETASRASGVAERAADRWEHRTKKLADRLPVLVPRVNLVPAVEHFFDFVQRAVDMNRGVAIRWARAVDTMSGAAREQAESAGEIVREQAEATGEAVRERSESFERAASEQAEKAERAQEVLAQEELAQEVLAQEELAQEELAQEELAQEELAQEELAQEVDGPADQAGSHGIAMFSVPPPPPDPGH